MDAPPTPDDLNFFVVVIHQVESWWRAFVTGGFVASAGLIWRVSGKYHAAEIVIRDHSERIDKQEARLAAVEIGQHAITVAIGALPTRAEQAAQSERIDARFDRLDGRLDRIAPPGH